jgi:hypothetical protein
MHRSQVHRGKRLSKDLRLPENKFRGYNITGQKTIMFEKNTKNEGHMLMKSNTLEINTF